MIFHSLQLRIVVVFVGLLVLVMALILLLVTRSNEHIITTEMKRELATGERVFSRLVEHNKRQLETAATVLSADFAFREAIATQDRPTIQSVIRNHGLRIGAQMMMVVSPNGQLVADTKHKDTGQLPFPYPELIDEANTGGKSSGFRTMNDGKVYQIVLVPILAPRLIAWVAMGFLVDDQWTNDFSSMTNLSVSIIWRQGASVAVLASSLSQQQRVALTSSLAGSPVGSLQIIALANEHYGTIELPLGHGSSAVLQRSVELAEEPFRALQTSLLVIVLLGVALFSLGSVMLSRRIVRPINQLTMATNRIEAGDYAPVASFMGAELMAGQRNETDSTEPAPKLPPDEIGQLAVNFEHMRKRVANREQQILKLAYEDNLTSLPNRTRFVVVFNQLAAGSQGAVAVLNLDRFALINNALGHSVGDRLLKEIGSRLSQLITETNLVARLWGDQFAFLLPGANHAAAIQFAQTVLAKLSDTIILDEQRLDVGGRMGIALYPVDGRDANSLLRRAEVAMFEAKRLHKNYVFAGDIHDEPLHEKLSLIGEMREALGRQEFKIYYQPKLNLENGKVDAAEALIRWQHPERGLVSPASFIPFAEQTGFISEITPWLLKTVAEQMVQWRKEGLFLTPSINLSALDLLNTDLVEQVRKLVEFHQITPQNLCLEITESALMEDPQLALRHLEELAALGVKLSIDDYGVGQASLSYLKTLPVHELKIDQIFINSVSSLPRNAAIVRSTITLCHALGLSVVAEGVETAGDFDWLMRNGCDTAQGYFISRPMPAHELAGWTAAYNAADRRPN
jgi:diguanylate cyclase (GGDEF)-like protein